MKITLSSLLVMFSLYGFSSTVLEEKLKEINSIISFKKIEKIGEFKECYEILIEQPINHENPDEGMFLQKLYLSHRDFNQPTVLVVNGYISYNNIVNEWSELFNSNQIYVEHRYFGKSKPENIVWETYKYFYPEDVSATIALSTSVKTEACDTSYFTYIDSLSKRNGCIKELKNFQKQLLSERDELIPLLKQYFDTHQKQYTHLGLDNIFENAVLEIPFSVWQNNNGCETIKNLNTQTIEDIFKSLRIALHDWFLTDDILINMNTYHYQAMTKLGYYCYPTSGLNELLKDSNKTASYIFPPENVEVSYSKELMIAIKQWLISSGNHIIYISGSNDPYSIYKITPENNVKSLSYILQNKNHNQVRYKNIDLKQREEVLNTINAWLNE